MTLQGMSMEEAQKAYIALVEGFIKKHGTRAA
jgi:acyl-CoA-binding protein